MDQKSKPNIQALQHSPTRALVQELSSVFQTMLEIYTRGIIVDGRVPAEAIRGIISTSSGGTGNGSGTTAPTPGTVTNGTIPDNADLDPAKLDQDLLQLILYTYAKTHLVEGSGVLIEPDDLLRTLTLSAEIIGSLAELSDVLLSGLTEGDILRYTGGKFVNVKLPIYAPVTNGDPDYPEIVFDGADVVIDLVG